MRKLGVWLTLVALVALAGLSYAAEAPDKPKDPPKLEEPKAEEPKEGEPARAEPVLPDPIDEGNPNDVVAKVDDITITRGELNQTRRLMSLAQRGPLPNNQQILEQLINRALWNRHFDKGNLRPTGPQIQEAIKNLDAQLRRQNSSYQRFLIERSLTVEEHAGMLSYELAMRRLIDKIQDEIKEEQVKAEYDAHPEFYDGSRIRISQIFIDTSEAGTDKKKLEEAKVTAEDLHKKLTEGKDFERLAKDFSMGAAAQQGGERGWFRRKGPEVDEPLIEAAWGLKVNEVTKPIRGVRGWHILKVTEREPAYLTFFGCKRGIEQELTRRKLEARLDDLKAAAKIERML